MLTHFETLEADFARYYDTDLPAAVWGSQPVTVRRLAVLVNGLPRESTTARALHPHPNWEQTEELLATIAELVDATNRLIMKAWFKGGDARPIEIRRPWKPEEVKPRKATVEEMKAFFGGNLRRL